MDYDTCHGDLLGRFISGLSGNLIHHVFSIKPQTISKIILL